MIRPQTIQIFLPDGSPTSIKEAEITNRLVKAVLFPRNKLQEVAKREIVHFTGVYFLFGTTEDGAKPLVYIGEGEECFKRIQSHNRNKDFWTHCVIIATKTNEYTKTEAKYLEHYCLDKANIIGRYETDNDTGSKKPSLPESREYDLLDNFETAKILLATLGYPIFEEKRQSKNIKELFYCKGKDASAVGEMIDDGFLVYKGGKCTLQLTPSAGPWVTNMRNKLLDSKVLMEENGMLVFQSDYIFDSVSSAAAAVLARRSNGWIEWKDKNGRTLDELKRQ
ncbi:hypothetical protein SB49_07965 [Sediminicola sp. YIK13]|uniref:GIY-YIG nuclease family protein n=1 Tax=Sediminicola sp. YIK13 TaxID=1453352 RepID=UPI00072210EF|nr:GIY-YIG nuclease family protein [Sediminicola sp. YIK13]ALM07746.1 hypothetical protein SB49_07965 [Sediminicola sp. YIK13]